MLARSTARRRAAAGSVKRADLRRRQNGGGGGGEEEQGFNRVELDLGLGLDSNLSVRNWFFIRPSQMLSFAWMDI